LTLTSDHDILDGQTVDIDLALVMSQYDGPAHMTVGI
jgi:hypothetical protein